MIPATDPPTLHPLLSDDAVLQRNQPIPIHGTARPTATVIVTLGGHGATTQSDADGHWTLLLPTMAARGPHASVVTCGETRTDSQNVMIGDVWLCAGQSNMALTLKGSDNADQNGASLEQHSIRLMSTARQLEAAPQTRFAAEHPTWVAWSGARVLSTTVNGNSLTVRFAHTEGNLMTINCGPVRGVEIAGADRLFVAAEAVITGPDTLTVSAAAVSEPVAVRYAWDDNPHFNLICSKGLMAAPFRSDDWTVPTQTAVVPFGNRWPVAQPAPQQAAP